MGPTLVLINPWIHDFAAYDLWAKPLGLLTLAAALRRSGYRIHLIDCLDVHHPSLLEGEGPLAVRRRLYGTGKYPRLEIPKPACLNFATRPYSRYGISPAAFQADLAAVPEPGAILVTSLMTYWYPGVQAAIAAARAVHPEAPVILGGIYARLCRRHAAATSGADHVVYEDDPQALIALLTCLGLPPPPAAGRKQPLHPYPAFDLLHGLDYICLLASRGCPYRCRYCAGPFLNPHTARREAQDVVDEIRYWRHEMGVADMAFYDDALLAGPGDSIRGLLEGIAREAPDVRFHTPNALHVREISRGTALLMRQAGFRTIRLGLESADFSDRRMDEKVRQGEFERAVENLLHAGFQGTEIGAYLLAGLPGQSAEAVHAALSLVEKAGVMPFISEYSPIPHTALWEAARAASAYDLAGEPLFHNNTLLPCWGAHERARLPELRGKLRTIRESVRDRSAHPPHAVTAEADFRPG
ncbi:B12-binding domain-containing radical SAM protein [Desulfatiglans anilini]|uniref:B12-binding domain-containing radical SAM protein n=1 Tax=Desulfatiglans anilini TaxID=90728 RepID=UPI000407186F|nr:B12-binding domain-containing radical SAM protein [Desulfatiglans anilini]